MSPLIQLVEPLQGFADTGVGRHRQLLIVQGRRYPAPSTAAPGRARGPAGNREWPPAFVRRATRPAPACWTAAAAATRHARVRALLCAAAGQSPAGSRARSAETSGSRPACAPAPLRRGRNLRARVRIEGWRTGCRPRPSAAGQSTRAAAGRPAPRSASFAGCAAARASGVKRPREDHARDEAA